MPRSLRFSLGLLASLSLVACAADVSSLDKGEGDAEPDLFLDGELDSASRPTLLGSLADGESAEGSFGRNARYLAWAFGAGEGDAITLRAEGLTRGVDPVLSLYRASSSDRPVGAAIATNDDCDSSTLNSCLSLDAPVRGRYVLVVRRYDRGNTGRVRVSLELGGAEQVCGGRSQLECPEGMFCSYAPEAICGRADASGVCAPRPEACTAHYDPVCGCDGRTYGNACTAANAGVSVDHVGECEVASAVHRRRVLSLTYDPRNPANPADRLSTRFGYTPSRTLADGVVDAVRRGSGGTVELEIVEERELDVFPLKADGYRYTWEEYLACRADSSRCHRPDTSAYAPIMASDTGADLCERIRANEIDEVWLWGFDYAGFDEFAYRIPGDRVRYPATPENGWIYDIRRYDLPDCGRTYFVMGFNRDVGVGNAVHSFGHRIESAMTSSEIGQGLWQRCDTRSEWTRFLCTGVDAGAGTVACGDVHQPPNATSGYEYGNEAPIQSACDDFTARYPDGGSVLSSVSVSTWSPTRGDTQLDYLVWWMDHFPRQPGTHLVNGVEIPNDWWPTILCYGEGC